jgi:flavorubredoxin
MGKLEIKKNIFWVGAVDWDIRSFHGHTYTTKRGTTYNAYLLVDEKIALVDTVYGPFTSTLIKRVKEIVPLEKIDYIIVNHVETDHSGALPEITQLCPKAKVVGSAKCKEGLWKNYYRDWDFQVVKTGDKLNLGRRTFTFIEAPMIHWPDSMFSYCPEEKLLLPNDAFGQHYATSERFDDETDQCALMDEAKKYYANILWPLGGLILKKIEELQKLNIPLEMIAPSHGIIWRKEPAKIINAYLCWAKDTLENKVVIVYETMWGATAKMARKIAEGVMAGGAAVKLFDIALADCTEVISEMLDARGFLIGSSTHDNAMLPNIAGFLEFVKGLKAKKRVAATFGSYGWAGGAQKEIEAVLKEAGLEISQPALAMQYLPDDRQLAECHSWGKDFAS